MVDTAQSSKKIFVGHPTTVRGHRTSFAVSGGFAYFGVRDNLVAKGLNSATSNEVSTIYTTSREKVSAVSVSNDGQKIAFGDDKGKVTILKWENGQLEQHKEHYMLTGIVNEIVWSKDNKVLVAVGEKACALNPESGSRTGDVLGATGKILCAVLTNENVLFSAGEGNEILRHDGVPFKGQGKPVKHPHTGFVNQMRLSPDKTKFATASSDKSICIFDSKSGEVIKHYPGAHAMGIYDLIWIDDQTFATASADNSVKQWTLESEVAQKTFETGQPRDTSRQLLSIFYFSEEHSLLGINLNSDFVWWSTQPDAPLTPSKVIPGHKDLLNSMLLQGQNLWYTSETGIFVLSYDEKSIKRVKSSHTLAVDRLTQNKHSVYASGFDKVVSKFEIGGENIETAKITLPNKALQIAADDEHVYILNYQQEISILESRNLSTKQTKKLSYEPTTLSVCGQSIWIGDKQGKLHVLDTTLTEVKAIETAAHPITALSSNGKIVAAGNGHRYVFVYDGQTLNEIFNCGDQKDKILDLFVSDQDIIGSAAHDQSYAVIDVASQKLSSHAKLPHGVKMVTNVLIKDNTHLITMGEDCALRQWTLQN